MVHLTGRQNVQQKSTVYLNRGFLLLAVRTFGFLTAKFIGSLELYTGCSIVFQKSVFEYFFDAEKVDR